MNFSVRFRMTDATRVSIVSLDSGRQGNPPLTFSSYVRELLDILFPSRKDLHRRRCDTVERRIVEIKQPLAAQHLGTLVVEIAGDRFHEW